MDRLVGLRKESHEIMKTVTIYKINLDTKWVEFWTTDNLAGEWDMSCKRYQLDDLVTRADLLAHVHNHGYAGLQLSWKWDGHNWEPHSVALPNAQAEARR